eukprot:3170371-Prymnesium_polylepis.2
MVCPARDVSGRIVHGNRLSRTCLRGSNERRSTEQPVALRGCDLPLECHGLDLVWEPLGSAHGNDRHRPSTSEPVVQGEARKMNSLEYERTIVLSNALSRLTATDATDCWAHRSIAKEVDLSVCGPSDEKAIAKHRIVGEKSGARAIRINLPFKDGLRCAHVRWPPAAFEHYIVAKDGNLRQWFPPQDKQLTVGSVARVSSRSPSRDAVPVHTDDARADGIPIDGATGLVPRLVEDGCGAAVCTPCVAPHLRARRWPDALDCTATHVIDEAEPDSRAFA